MCLFCDPVCHNTARQIVSRTFELVLQFGCILCLHQFAEIEPGEIDESDKRTTRFLELFTIFALTQRIEIVPPSHLVIFVEIEVLGAHAAISVI